VARSSEITAQHHRGHVVRAILEGVAFSLRDSLEIFRELGIPVQSIRLGGGGARSELWRQIQTDIFGMDTEIVEAEEGPAYGAALLAGVGSGVWSSVEDACEKSVRVAQRLPPDPGSASRMNLRYAVYRRMYAALRGIFHELQNS
jgi:xylulokinase